MWPPLASSMASRKHVDDPPDAMMKASDGLDQDVLMEATRSPVTL